MTPSIKQRIEQIRRREVPEGYKKEKLGIVPEEWNETSFSTLFTSTSDYTDDLDKYALYSLTIEDGITPKTERYERSHLVKKEDSYKIVRPNDYAYNPMNLRFGAVARHKGDMPVAVSGYYDIFTTVHESDLPFMDSFLTCGPMITYYNRVSTGSLVEKQRVHFSQFLEFVLPLPSINERAQIATILSTQDKVIELKGKRLTERQRQKKYLMQQLLTGKRRLPGFSGEWSMQPLSQLSKVITKKTADEEYEVLSISAGIGFVNQSEKFGKQIAGEQYKNYIVISRGDFSYNKGNSKKYPQGCIYPLESRECAAVPNVFISFTMQKGKCFWKYYKYLFENGWLNKQLYRLINSGVRNDGLLNLSDKEFFNCVVPVPPFKEQTAIAEILSTSDREIDLLQQDIEQEKKKKKALMQLLLTGIVRVKT